MFTNKLTFNGDLWVLGSRWSWSRLVLVGTELLFLFGSLQFLLVVRLLLSMQLLLDLERSAAMWRDVRSKTRDSHVSIQMYLY